MVINNAIPLITLINTVAILLTCHNRKDKTIKCLKHLFLSKEACSVPFDIDVYVTDDGSGDGTGTEIKDLFPSVNVLVGSGNDYWAGGMRIAWKAAMIQRNYDGYLLLNDDTYMDDKCFGELFRAHDYSMKNYGKGSIYLGSVKDHISNEHTYGGSILLNRWTLAKRDILPDGNIKECHLGNANIMFVHNQVVKTIGILSEKYIHAMADFDYTLRAREKKFPILVCSDYCGSCIDDTPDQGFNRKNLKERIQFLKSPKGFELSGYMYYMRRFFPFRAPFVYCSLWLKTLFPCFTGFINKIMNR